MKISFQFTVALVLFWILNPCLASSQSTPGEEMLNKTIQVYKNAKTYRDESTVSMKSITDGVDQSVDFHYSLSIENPDRFSVRSLKPDSGIFLIYDGRELLTYISNLQKYMVQPNTGTSSAVLAKSVYSGNFMPGQGLLPVRMIMEDPMNDIKKEFSSIELAENEVQEGRELAHLILRHSSGKMEMHLYIDTASSCIVRMTADITQLMSRRDEEDQPAPNDTFIIEEKHLGIQLNEPVPSDVYVFNPPAGVQKTDDLFRENRPPDPEAGKPASDFSLRLLGSKQQIELSKMSGKVVMLDFWATWCGPCRQELPILQRIYDKYREKNFAFFAVNVRENESKVQSFIDSMKYTFPVALDTEGKVSQSYQVPGFPTLFLIDSKGVVRKVHVGFNMNLEQELSAEIEELLDKNTSGEITK